jgi:membrane-bound ClpP family serine protease
MEFTAIICFLGVLFFALTLFIAASIRIVREDTRLSVFRLGRYLGDKGPGIVLIIPFIDRGEIKELGGLEKTPSRRLVGVVGETRTTVFTEGKVSLAGEEWDAISHTPIAAGRRVRVVRSILEVEEE